MYFISRHETRRVQQTYKCLRKTSGKQNLHVSFTVHNPGPNQLTIPRPSSRGSSSRVLHIPVATLQEESVSLDRGNFAAHAYNIV